MKNKKYIGLGMATGVAIGSIIGMVLNNGGLWIPVGIAIGAGIGRRMDIKRKNEEQNQA